jgi:hypothetical protein
MSSQVPPRVEANPLSPVAGSTGSLVAAACSSNEGSPSSAPVGPEATTAEIPNRGDDTEGHTPRGFPGSGTGPFTGDNLNSSFPDGDGVQMYLTFDLPEVLSRVTS